jgi:hypothetical protein
MSAQSSWQDIAATASAIADRIGVSFPASATPVYAQKISGHDDAARLIYEMPTADWYTMRSSPPFDAIGPEYWSPDNAHHLGQDEGAWNPRSVKGMPVVQIPLKDGTESLNVGATPVDGDTMRVYVFWFQL